MEIETKEILTTEEKRLIDKIRTIKSNPDVLELISKINAQSENMGIPKFKFRIKEESSALEKFRQKGYEDADRLGDICGMMFITEDESQIYEVVEYIKKILSGKQIEEDDYVKNPKAGYRSFHINSQITNISSLDGISLPIEIQIKTRSMSIAQDTVHDSIYKNDNLPKQTRNYLSTALFPIFEKMSEIDRLSSLGKIDEVSKLEEEIKSIKAQNTDLFSQYDEEVKQAYREYGKTLFRNKNEKEIEQECFLASEGNEEKRQRKQKFNEKIDAVFDYYEQEGIQIGEEDPINYAINKMKELDYESFSILLNRESSIESKDTEEIPPLLKNAIECSKEEISSSDIVTMVKGVNNKSRESTIPNKETVIEENTNTER